MEHRGFDEIAKRFAGTSQTRRTAMRLLAGTALGGVLARLGTYSGAAATITCKKLGQRCRRRRQCCSGRCLGKKGKKSCRPHNVGTCKRGENFCQQGIDATCGELCFCFVTTGNAPFCGRRIRGVECQRDSECVALGLPAGSACVRNNGAECEVETSTFCVAPFDQSAPEARPDARK